MNTDTLALIRRQYSEIVDDLLTAVVGGVVNEPIVFEVTADIYTLAEPARDIRAITGVSDGLPRGFLVGVDFVFDPAENAVVWLDGGTRPDNETVFFVDYLRPAEASRSPLTDINVGSVTRTLNEAVGREIAVVYEQVNQAYLAAFVDTAKGTSLDLVVAILGLTRRSAEYAIGLVTFYRDPAVSGTVTIPVGTVLTTAGPAGASSPGAGAPTFETTEPRTLHRGQVRVDVPVRASVKGPDGKVPAGAITGLAQPMAGIARVTNAEATLLGAVAETDDELRTRAKAALRGLGKATLSALDGAITAVNARLVEAWDPNGPPGKQSPPGAVSLIVSAEPERFPGVAAAVDDTRAAGVLATVVGRYVYATPRLTATVAADLAPAAYAKIAQDLIDEAQSYVDPLGPGDPVVGRDLLAAFTAAVPDAREPRFVDVLAARADLARPGPQALAERLADAVATVPAGDRTAQVAALTGVLTEARPSAPSASRIPDRDLVRGPSGQRATDAEIESADFTVAATVDGEPWSIFLAMSPADILLTQDG